MGFILNSYRFGLEGVAHYLLVGICVGFMVAIINILGEVVSWEDLKEWGWDQTYFVARAFLVGMFLWPVLLAPTIWFGGLALLLILAMLTFGLPIRLLWLRC